jgi:enoyl-CoA hydratase/carnithine racemase
VGVDRSEFAGGRMEEVFAEAMEHPEEALRIGLVNRVLAPEELVEVARTLARDIASLPAGMSESAKRGLVARQPRLLES